MNLTCREPVPTRGVPRELGCAKLLREAVRLVPCNPRLHDLPQRVVGRNLVELKRSGALRT